MAKRISLFQRPLVNLSNPVLLYSLVWLVVLFLVSMRLTTNLLRLNFSTGILVVGNVLSFGLIYGLLRGVTPRREEVSKENLSRSAYRLTIFIKPLLYAWLIGSLIDIAYSGGVPLFWSLSGEFEKNYTGFGIPTFHGLMNGLYLFVVTGLFFSYMVRRDKKPSRWALLLLAWPIVVLARGVLLSAVCQMAGVYFCLKRVSIKTLSRALVVSVLVIALFGWLGDIRGRDDSPFSYLVNTQEQSEIFQALPSGFLWCYVYVTAPLNNVIDNINRVRPTYVPYRSVINLLPTVTRSWIAPGVSADSLELVNENLTVSTFYAGFLSDFGLIGALIGICILQFICVTIYSPAHDRRPWAILAYAVLFECITFSVFYNLFFLPTYIFQVLLAFYFRMREKRLQKRVENENRNNFDLLRGTLRRQSGRALRIVRPMGRT